MFYRKQYEKFDGLECSAEILAAIETVTESSFFYERHDENSAAPYEEMAENAAYKLWENGCGEDKAMRDKILAALPTEHEPEDGDELTWGGECFAEFDGERWNSEEVE